MKNIKNKIACMSIILLSFSLFMKVQAQPNLGYTAYLINSEQLSLQFIKQTDHDEWGLSKAYYGLLSTCMATKNEKLFDEYVDEALELLEKLEAENHHKAEAKALRSSIYGYIMGFSPMKGMFYGPKSTTIIDDALAIDKESGIVWMVKASSLFYTPEMFGGDKQAAEKAYEKSIQFFEKKGLTENNWMYLNALAGLGQTYLANGKKEEAIATYKKALKIEANFNWVAKVLLPKAEQS